MEASMLTQTTTESRDTQVAAHSRPTIVLVHGDWADGSSWSSVIERLQERGFTVLAPPNPLRGPAADASYLAGYLRTISGPIVLVAHSYGGVFFHHPPPAHPHLQELAFIYH